MRLMSKIKAIFALLTTSKNWDRAGGDACGIIRATFRL